MRPLTFPAEDLPADHDHKGVRPKRIRVEGTETEITAAVERLATVLDVQEASRFYANRGS